MTGNTITVGIIGAGGNTRKFHIPGLQKQKGVEVVAVANRTIASGQAAADEFGIPNVCASWEEIVYDGDIDAICIGTWPYMHAPITIAALESGKHVLCEARMAMNSREAHAMLEVSQMNPSLVAQIVPAPLTFKFDRMIAEMVGKGFIGDLISVDARVALGSNFPNAASPVHWRQLREFSGNNIMAMGIIYEGLMRWVGPARSVQAVGQNVVKHRVGDDGQRVAMSIPDHIDIIGEMEQGGQMRLCMTTVSGLMPAIDINICGTEGALRLTDQSGTLTLLSGNRRATKLTEVKIPKARQLSWRVEEEFINAIRGKEAVRFTDFVTGTRYMEWTDAVSAALRTGEKVFLPLDASMQG
ncbi:MAG: Gfo/Idh/MocA family oxidoreductase [Pseudomonadota bacterium]